MKNYKSWLDDIKFDNNLDFHLEPDDHYFNFEVSEVRFPSDDEDEVA